MLPSAGMSVPRRFEQLVRTHGSQLAIISGSWRPTYTELNAASNRLAHRLISGVGDAGDRVALLMRHDGPLIAANLGILKARRVVVVLNPSDPQARLRQVLDDADPSCIVTDSAHHDLAAQLAGDNRRVIGICEIEGESAENPALAVAPGDLAILKYTSGSTGRPKAVMHPHCNILDNARRLAGGLMQGPGDRSTLLASLSGGQGIATLWATLLTGGTICPFPVMERGMTGLADWLDDQQITIWVSSASLFRHFVMTLDGERRFPNVRAVRLASESVNWEDAAAWRRHFTGDGFFLHTFSSSETGNVTQNRITTETPLGSGRLPIGSAVAGMEVLLLDGNERVIELDGTGEIAIRSRYLSTGYWRRDDLTAERYSGESGPSNSRVFRTGDFARREKDGSLVFAGRVDERVKVRGYRIEISEIEESFRHVAGVERAIVRARTVGNEDSRLIAYIVRRAGDQVSSDTIRTALGKILPAAFIPAQMFFLERIPVTPTGKVDRRALDRMVANTDTAPSLRPAMAGTEAVLAEIWKSVLKRSEVGGDSNFFDLGGDSLCAAVVAARVHAETGVQMDLRFFVEHPTLAGFAEAIDCRSVGTERETAPSIPRVPRGGPLPLSYLQERTWRFSQTPEQSAGYTVACVHRLIGPLDIDLFRRGISELVRRHEILRTTFAEVEGAPVWHAHPAEPIEIPLIDISGQPDAEARLGELLLQQSAAPFDLSRLPLIRFVLVSIGECDHCLLRVNHHIISDGWSWRIFFQELGAWYEAELAGNSQSFGEEEGAQYADYAAWQRRTLDRQSPAYREAVGWWRELFDGARGPLELPTRQLIGPPNAKPEDGLIWWGLDPNISRRLEVIARARGATYFMIRLAAFITQLGWETHNTDIVLGMYSTNRTQIQTQRMFGFFANLTTLRMRLAPGRSFADRLREVQELVSQVQARSSIPYDQLGEELRQEGTVPPEIRAVFGVSDQRVPVRLGEVELTWVNQRVNTMPWGFSLSFDRYNEASRCSVMFDARLYDPAWVQAFVNRYVALLDEVSRDPEVICWPENGRTV